MDQTRDLKVRQTVNKLPCSNKSALSTSVLAEEGGCQPEEWTKTQTEDMVSKLSLPSEESNRINNLTNDYLDVKATY